MKLTKDTLRQLIVEALSEGDVLQGKFGGRAGVDLGKPASVSQLHKQPKMPEGTEWLEDASSLVDEVMNNIDEIAKTDEGLAKRLFDLAEKLSPIFKAGHSSMSELPDDAFEDDPEKEHSTSRSYEENGPTPEDEMGG